MNTTEEAGGTLEERVVSRLAGMSRAERRVAEYLRNHQQDAVFASADEIGIASGTSDATVVRTAKALGYSGLTELKHLVGQEMIKRPKASERLYNRIEEVGPETSSLLSQLFRETYERLAETERQLSNEDFDRALDILAGARRTLCFGLGPSEGNAHYLALRLSRLGYPASGTGATGFRLADNLLMLTGADAVVLFSPARLLREHEVILSHVQSLGARSILITDSLGPVLGDRVDLVLRAAYSQSGFTGEAFSSMILADALFLGLAARDESGTTTRSDLLIKLRSELINSDSRELVSRALRRPSTKDAQAANRGID
jgi:DNA-binding MurR/RpiR family transcriptional regulator